MQKNSPKPDCSNGPLYNESNFYEDWESTGKEEMNNLHEQVKGKMDNSSRDAWNKLCKKEKEEEIVTLIDVRDRLNRIYSLVEVCQFALWNRKDGDQSYCQQKVAEVLFDYVRTEIKTAEEELANL